MNRKLLISILVAVTVLVILGFDRQDPRHTVSCDQNTGPFENSVSPGITKEKLKSELTIFYEQCLKPEFRSGFFKHPMNGNSESQSYALWQAYWAGDKKTFDRVWTWTQDNLKRSQDNLISWRYRVEERNILQAPEVIILDDNSATDADTDIAHVLLRAGTVWENHDYIQAGKDIVKDIWEKETVEIQGKRYVIAGNWANEPDRLVINPSYFSPQAYRTFSLHDGEHDWHKVTTDTYELIEQTSRRGGEFVMPLNWVAINKSDGSIVPYPEKEDAADYSYDAFRTLWRVSLDQVNTPSFASWNYVSSIKTFERDWAAFGRVCALYRQVNSEYHCDYSTTTTLAGPLAIFSVTNGYLGAQLVEKYYIRDGKLKFPDTEYYAKSWHWFGSWLWANS